MGKQLMLEHNTWSGRINYIHDDGHERGREWFTVTTHQQGYRVVRAMCEMDDSQILRDVTFTLTDDFKPVEAYVRLVKAGKHKGSAWFTFEGDEAKCESWMSDLGRVSQKITVAGGVASFGPHPVLCDCFHTALYDHSNPLRIQPVERILHSSPEPDGSTGPMLGRWEFGVEYVGEERISVPAGEFDTLHYRFNLENYGWPPEDIWVLPGSRQFVKIRWDVLKTTYVLAELNGVPN